jgi:hypothetical protein
MTFPERGGLSSRLLRKVTWKTCDRADGLERARFGGKMRRLQGLERWTWEWCLRIASALA